MSSPRSEPQQATLETRFYELRERQAKQKLSDSCWTVSQRGRKVRFFLLDSADKAMREYILFQINPNGRLGATAVVDGINWVVFIIECSRTNDAEVRPLLTVLHVLPC